MSANTKLFLLVFSVFVIKICVLPYAQVTDADAVSRIFISDDLFHRASLDNTTWAPFHFYLGAFSLWCLYDYVYAPLVLNILFSVLTLIPFYFFVKREYSSHSALICAVLLAASPILFRLSFLFLSETPFLFFVVLGMNCLSKAIKENSKINYLFAGLSITIAAGFRYEAWLLCTVLFAVIFVFKKYKEAFYFLFAAALYPLISILQNIYSGENLLMGIAGNSDWTINAMGVNKNVTIEDYLRRVWSFPFFWLIAIGPFTAFFTLKAMFTNKEKRIWTIPFWLVLAVMIYSAIQGKLMLHNRFVVTLLVLSLPFVASYFDGLKKNRLLNLFLFVSSTFTLGFIYNVDSVSPISRLKDQSAVEIANIIQVEKTNEHALMVDFWSWENSYYVALNSRVPKSKVVIVDGAPNLPLRENEIVENFSKNAHGFVLLCKESKLYNKAIYERNFLSFSFLKDLVRPVKLKYKNENVMLLEWFP